MNKSPPRNNRLMNIMDIEKDFMRHHQRITRVKNRNTVKQLKKTHNSQMDMINSFRKNWVHSHAFKNNEQNRTISSQNKILLQSLNRQYHRVPSVEHQKKFISTIKSNSSSSRISLSTANRRKKDLMEDNIRLRQKILTI